MRYFPSQETNFCAYPRACGSSIVADNPSIRSVGYTPRALHLAKRRWAAEELYKSNKKKIRKRILDDRTHTAASTGPARAGATCPTTASEMIAMVEEASFITADLSGKLQNVDEDILRLSIAFYNFRSFPSHGWGQLS